MGFAEIFKGLVTGDPIKSIGDLINQFHLSPEQQAQMQQAAQELGVKRDEIETARDQALAEIKGRNVESSPQKQAAVRGVLPPLLALVVTVGFFGLVYILTYHEVPSGSQQVMYAMVGVLGSAWVAVINYYFGTSAGSARKTEIMANQAAGRRNLTGNP